MYRIERQISKTPAIWRAIPGLLYSKKRSADEGLERLNSYKLRTGLVLRSKRVAK